jgi:Uma2 family endonuclease
MSAQKYLSLPEEKPYLEYIDGVVEQKPMVNAGHGRLVRRLDAMFDRHISAHGGDAGPERRVLTPAGYFLPDTAYWAAGKPSGDDSVPTVAVEVRSPGQSIQVLRDKCAGYLAAGVAECWLIDPEARTLERLPIGDGELLDSKATLVSSAMPEFELRLGELFALLDQ